MPHFSKSGHDEVICQKCTRIVDTGKESVDWRPDITGSQSAGNVCGFCVIEHERSNEVVSLYEHCRRESGLTGAALDRYINRYYGHG